MWLVSNLEIYFLNWRLFAKFWIGKLYAFHSLAFNLKALLPTPV